MATKESRIIRTRNIASGLISFLDKRSKKTVTCDARDLFKDLPEAGFDIAPFDYSVRAEQDANWLEFWTALPLIVRHLILHGINGKVGDTVASKDKDGPKTMRESWKALVGAIWSQGGGGSPLDTFTVVLRQMVSDALVSIGVKRVDADKATRTDTAAAYLAVVEHLTPKGGNVKAGFDKVWPKVQENAKIEAERRDNAPATNVADLLAAATTSKAA